MAPVPAMASGRLAVRSSDLGGKEGETLLQNYPLPGELVIGGKPS